MVFQVTDRVVVLCVLQILVQPSEGQWGRFEKCVLQVLSRGPLSANGAADFGLGAA